MINDLYRYLEPLPAIAMLSYQEVQECSRTFVVMGSVSRGDLETPWANNLETIFCFTTNTSFTIMSTQ